ncbi:MAG: carotenoid oxygenase family protein [Acidimicrobiia bacterium]
MTITEPVVSTSPYLTGNFAPVREEVSTDELPVTGAIPEELEGRLLRIGPNPVVDPDPATYHWFTGSGMVHGLWLRGGRAVTYRNRYVRSDSVVETLGGAATHGPRHGMGDNTANTNVIAHAGTTFAIVEAGGLPMQLTDDLETVARSDFGGTLPGSFTAHPHRDPATGELHAVAYYWEWDYLQYIVVGIDGRVRRTVNVPVPGSPMVHDCAITESRVVLLDMPVTFSLDAAMNGATLPYRWDAEYGARVGLLTREADADSTVWCELDDLCYVYHPLNAYDDGDNVVMDVAVHPKMFASDINGPNEGPPVFERWTMNPAARRVSREVISDVPQEFPRVDERLTGRQHRYGYCAMFGGTGLSQPSNIIKHDLVAGTAQIHDLGGRMSQEPVFVPKGASAAEDEGWVMAYVHDPERNAADVVIIDAQDFSGPPVATIHLPVRVPFGFHGNWVAS